MNKISKVSPHQDIEGLTDKALDLDQRNGNLQIRKFKKVTELPSHKHIGSMITIRAYGNLPLQLTPEQLLYAVQRVRKSFRFNPKSRLNWADLKARWIPTGELKKGDCVVFPYPSRIVKQEQYDLLDYVKRTKGFRCH